MLHVSEVIWPVPGKLRATPGYMLSKLPAEARRDVYVLRLSVILCTIGKTYTQHSVSISEQMGK